MPDDFRKLQGELCALIGLLGTMLNVSSRVDGWRPDVQAVIGETMCEVLAITQSRAKLLIKVCQTS